MHRIFPPALIGCIADDRAPTDDEIQILSVKIWEESVRFLNAGSQQLAMVMARAASSGAGRGPL